MATLYEILGVTKDADAKALRRGYVTMSKRYHPDKPHGDRAKFEEVDHAYKGLKDPAKRAFYDQTGSLPEDKPVPSENAEMYALIQRALQAVMQNSDPDRTDLVKSMVQLLNTEMRQVKAQIAEAVGKKNHLKKIQKCFRVTKDGADNVVAKIMQMQIESLAGGIRVGELQVENAAKAVEFLKDYKYDNENSAPRQQYGSMFNTTAA